MLGVLVVTLYLIFCYLWNGEYQISFKYESYYLNKNASFEDQILEKILRKMNKQRKELEKIEKELSFYSDLKAKLRKIE